MRKRSEQGLPPLRSLDPYPSYAASVLNPTRDHDSIKLILSATQDHVMRKRLTKLLSTITWIMGCAYLKPWALKGAREECRETVGNDDSALWLIHDTELLEQRKSQSDT